MTRERPAILLTLLLALLPWSGVAQTTSTLSGFAHIAIAVGNLQQSRDFYSKLGFEEAFHFGEGDAITQSFLKINDQQFIELYPATAKQPAGFLHLCFTGTLDPLNAIYAARKLDPKPVRKARAGNLLFTMAGPETPTGRQNIEYTQYLPGSLHFEDHGKHLSGHPMATSLFAVGLAVRDRDAARSFYIDKLDFTAVPGHPGVLQMPGPSHQQIVLRGDRLGIRSEAFLLVPDLKSAAARLRQIGLTAVADQDSLTLTDPDGNLLVLQSTPVADAAAH